MKYTLVLFTLVLVLMTACTMETIPSEEVEQAALDCVGDGETLREMVTVNGECCEGLHEISSGYRDGIVFCTSEVCGNGECKAKENPYNCEDDCA